MSKHLCPTDVYICALPSLNAILRSDLSIDMPTDTHTHTEGGGEPGINLSLPELLATQKHKDL